MQLLGLAIHLLFPALVLASSSSLAGETQLPPLQVQEARKDSPTRRRALPQARHRGGVDYLEALPGLHLAFRASGRWEVWLVWGLILPINQDEPLSWALQSRP
jgi:hypothetical protein